MQVKIICRIGGLQAQDYFRKIMDAGTHSRRRLPVPVGSHWNGDNMYEGLIIFAERENIVDLSEWLRLTSLVCNQYRRCARAQTLSKSTKKHEH